MLWLWLLIICHAPRGFTIGYYLLRVKSQAMYLNILPYPPGS